MRAVVERVHSASVSIDGQSVASIGTGLLVYVGVGTDDTERDADYLADKIRHLRIFPDDNRPLNRDVVQSEGSVLAISAFTTQADARKGRRPTLDGAADPDTASALYNRFCTRLESLGTATQTGRFRAHMDITLVNDGPICVLLDSKRAF